MRTWGSFGFLESDPFLKVILTLVVLAMLGASLTVGLIYRRAWKRIPRHRVGERGEHDGAIGFWYLQFRRSADCGVSLSPSVGSRCLGGRRQGYVCPVWAASITTAECVWGSGCSVSSWRRAGNWNPVDTARIPQRPFEGWIHVRSWRAGPILGALFTVGGICWLVWRRRRVTT